MSEEVYLYNLDWYHVHDNIGCVKGAFALKDSLSFEEYKELFKETYYILTTKKEIERLNNIINELDIFIEKEINSYDLDDDVDIINALCDIQNKLQELKGSDKE